MSNTNLPTAENLAEIICDIYDRYPGCGALWLAESVLAALSARDEAARPLENNFVLEGASYTATLETKVSDLIFETKLLHARIDKLAAQTNHEIETLRPRSD